MVLYMSISGGSVEEEQTPMIEGYQFSAASHRQWNLSAYSRFTVTPTPTIKAGIGNTVMTRGVGGTLVALFTT